MRYIYWADLKTTDFHKIDSQSDFVIIPMAATEQHGNHLPLATDSDIMDGLLHQLVKKSYDEDSQGRAYILPTQTIGYSIEHKDFAGSLTLSPEILLTIIKEITTQISALGFKKIIFLSSHGGNNELAAILSRYARAELNMEAFSSHWLRFLNHVEKINDFPLNEKQQEEDIHGGFIETSLMLYFKPEKVDMKAAENFEINASIYFQNSELKGRKRISRPISQAWMAQDLNTSGVVGNAALATTEWGEIISNNLSQNFNTFIKNLLR